VSPQICICPEIDARTENDGSPANIWDHLETTAVFRYLPFAVPSGAGRPEWPGSRLSTGHA